MEKKEQGKPRVTIRRVMVPRWQNLSAAAELLGVTETQVKRHVTGREHSAALERRMRSAGVFVESAI